MLIREATPLALLKVAGMTDETMQRRLRSLAEPGRCLLDDEAGEAQAIADRLGVTLRWRRLDLRTGFWAAG